MIQKVCYRKDTHSHSFKEMAAPIEAALQFFMAPPQAVETVHIKICEAITQTKQPNKNITKEERDAIKELREDKGHSGLAG